jgi:2-hydroxychromene-2-carboxylate isomerase
VEFWFEFGSTYSYPAAFRVEEATRNAGVELTWRPFLLGPIFKEQGWNDSPFNLYPAKGRYMWRDLERICAELQIPLRRPSMFPRNGLLAARVACRFENESWLPEFVRRVYLANFAYDRDISERAEIVSILEGLDLRSDLLTAAESPESKEKLRAQTDRAEALGIFGAPTFVSENEIFWGNDRLQTAISWAQRRERNTESMPILPGQ